MHPDRTSPTRLAASALLSAALIAGTCAACGSGSSSSGVSATPPRSTASSPASSGPASSGPASSRPASSGTAAGVHSAGEVAARVKTFYDRHIADWSKKAVVGYVTPALATRLFAPGLDYDAVLCAQNIPASVTYTAPVLTGSTATVTATTHWDSSPDQPIIVTVGLKDLLISDITCPPAG